MKKVSLIICSLACVALLLCSCSSSSSDTDEPTVDTTTQVTPITLLPSRTVRVYWGFDNQWHQITNSANASKWTYVKDNLTGFYTNFIDMWCILYQNSESASSTLQALCNTFKNKNCFFETSMETAVNSGTNGFNNCESDRRSLDLLTKAGFNVDYTSLNYMTVAAKDSCKAHIALLKKYDGTRNCLFLCGPWCFNGNITNDADAVTMSSWCDGTETDGPLGYWYANVGSMKQCSYSIVKYMLGEKKPTAIMLAPYDAGVTGYAAKDNFLTVSKDCVLGHEDNGAAPDIWTLWMYGSGGLSLFPESSTDSNGEVTPVNSATGVAYWLLKHLNEFPVLKVDDATKTSLGITTSSSDNYNLSVKTGQTTKIPIVVTNGNCPQVELSPVIRAVLSKISSAWKVVLRVKSINYSKDFIYNGGFNFVSIYRISKNNPVTITAEITPQKASSSLSIGFEVMTNLTNTTNKKTMMTLNLTSK